MRRHREVGDSDWMVLRDVGTTRKPYPSNAGAGLDFICIQCRLNSDEAGGFGMEGRYLRALLHVGNHACNQLSAETGDLVWRVSDSGTGGTSGISGIWSDGVIG